MKKTTLASADNRAQHLNAFVVAEPKVGKTTFLAASALGALPEQKCGLVTSPEHLHILAFDSVAVEGLDKFLLNACKKPESWLAVDVINMADDIRQVYATEEQNNYRWLVAVRRAIADIQKAVASKPGVHAVIASSLTGAAETFVRALGGAPSDGTTKKSGSGMDQDKWQMLSGQLVDFRAKLATDSCHVLWEGHIAKTPEKDNKPASESIQIPGKTGQNWGFNVDQVFRLKREMVKYPNSIIDKVFMDTRPNMEFTAGGRGFGTQLDPREYDLARVAEKLGKRVGGMQ